jgi:hypothetical protein
MAGQPVVRRDPPQGHSVTLTAAQDQMLDLLIARHRLGEPFWPIDNALRRTAKVLEGKGLIEILHGHVDGTFRASLTAKALEKYVKKATYTAPLERRVRDQIVDHLTSVGGDPTTIRLVRKMWSD